MRTESFLNAFLVSLASLPGQASSQALTAVSIPSQCMDICAPIRELTGTCDINMAMEMTMDMKSTEMKAEMDCICNNKSFNVKDIMGLCASCMGMNAGSGNKTTVQNVDMMLNECSFPTKTYTPAANSILEGVKVDATKPVTTMTMWNDTDPYPESRASGAASGSASGSASATGSMGGMAMGAAGRLEVDLFSTGMLMASVVVGISLMLGTL
ncbi:hypothetical protein K504DRAFT_534223 [Pleomassaria siparia CBS 279.74]|uniref:Protein CAP22 n=1 Tax=Pleomassaria siparia CBS 279.74 TaxID=1314801 RepID=A0A6G1K6V4_9PLEO|nr:hypothetical protein K504DRAFT_534223 [Pleomassaria siparia CBS 279.74]